MVAETERDHRNIYRAIPVDSEFADWYAPGQLLQTVWQRVRLLFNKRGWEG
jgi:hypothetical protein